MNGSITQANRDQHMQNNIQAFVAGMCWESTNLEVTLNPNNDTWNLEETILYDRVSAKAHLFINI